MVQNTYKTNRLVLQLANPIFGVEVAQYYTRNREFLRQWEPLRKEAFFTPYYQQNALYHELGAAINGTDIQFWIRLGQSQREQNLPATQPAPIIGMISLNAIVRGAFCSAYLAYKLDKEYLRQGLMSEALEKVIQIAFTELGLHRLEANVLPRNLASIALAKKAGFKEEGIARKYLKINGVWEDHLHLVLLNEPEKILPPAQGIGGPMVREATAEDLPELLALYTQFKGEPMPEPSGMLDTLWYKVQEQNQRIIVVVLGGEIVASCTVVILYNLNHDLRPYGLVENVITHNRHRRKGYGAMALQYVGQIAIMENCYKLMLMTSAKEKGTLDFYEKAGYNRQDKTAFVQWL